MEEPVRDDGPEAPVSASAQPDLILEELHFRRIDLRGFRRSDGLFELRARLTDQKPFDFQPPARDDLIPAGNYIHDHVLRVVFDEDRIIREIATTMQTFPYRECPPGGDVMQQMVGVRIGPGWSGEIRRRLPASEVCTHLKELMVVVATAAYQTLFSVRTREAGDVDAQGRPGKIDSCYAYGASRELVLRYWPEFHRPAPAIDDSTPPAGS